MYRTLIVLVALMVTLKLVNAQSAAVKGVVTDADTHEKLPGVSVVIDDTAGTVTGADGDFNYTVNAGTHNIEFRYVGYEKQRFTIVLKTDDTRVLNIDLKNSSQQLGTVVVSASKFEQKLNEVVVSMDVIKPKDIENTNRFDMEEAVSNVPGVVVIDGQANIRGGSGFSYGAGSRVLVLVDDLPILAADANDVKWSFMPLESMHQLEVIKGASSALFGSSAMSGVINLRTAYPKDKPETKIWMFSGFYDQPKSKEMKWWPDYATQSFSGLNFNHSQKIKQFDLEIIRSLNQHFGAERGVEFAAAVLVLDNIGIPAISEHVVA